MVYFVVVTVGEDSQDMDKRMEYYLVQKWKCKYFNMEVFSGMYVPGYYLLVHYNWECTQLYL